MNRHCLLAFFCLIVTALSSQSSNRSIVQSSNRLVGTVRDADAQPAAFATVLLWHWPDSTLAKGALTDSLGHFEMSFEQSGQYRLSANLLGAGAAFSPVFECNGSTCSAPELRLAERNLAGVTITGRRPVIEARADRLVFNVDNNGLTAGLNGLEVLRRSPGVSVDPDQQISLRGKSNVQIYVNGKRSPLTGADLAAFLQGLNAADIEAVEIIANPGAQFDAEGNAGVINIRLKKNRSVGFNSNVSTTLTQGVTPKGEIALGTNYRNGRLNAFGSGSFSTGRWHNSMNLNSVVADTLYAQQAPNWRQSNNFNGRAGLDWTFNSRHTLGVLFNGGLAAGESAGNSVTFVSVENTGEPLKVLRSDRIGDFNRHNLNSNLNYRFADTSGHTLNVDFDHGQFRNDGADWMPNVWRNATETQVLEENNYRNQTPTAIDIFTVKADYTQRLGAHGQLGAGLKASDVRTQNTFDFFRVLASSEQLDVDRSNSFTYREQIQAGYLSYETPLAAQWGLKMGLRAERTHARGDLLAFKPGNTQNVDTTYLLLFPSAALSFNPSAQHGFSVSYRRSLDRPGYRDLNPFEFKLDELNFSRGNPFLFPQTTGAFELNYNLLQRYSLSVSAARTRNFFTNLTDTEVDAQTGRQSFYLTKRNFGTRRQYNVSFSAPVQLTGWWSLYGNVYLNHEQLRGDFGGERVIDLDVTNFGLWAQQTIQLGAQWSLECSGWFSSGGLWGAYVNRPQGMLDAGISRRLWDGRGSLKLTVGDVLGTAGWRAETNLGALRTYGNGTWEAQTVRVQFSYRWGNAKIKGARERAAGLEEEQNRT